MDQSVWRAWKAQYQPGNGVWVWFPFFSIGTIYSPVFLVKAVEVLPPDGSEFEESYAQKQAPLTSAEFFERVKQELGI